MMYASWLHRADALIYYWSIIGMTSKWHGLAMLEACNINLSTIVWSPRYFAGLLRVVGVYKMRWVVDLLDIHNRDG